MHNFLTLTTNLYLNWNGDFNRNKETVINFFISMKKLIQLLQDIAGFIDTFVAYNNKYL